MKTYFQFFMAGSGYLLLVVLIFAFIIAEVGGSITIISVGNFIEINFSVCAYRVAVLWQTGGSLTGMIIA